MINICTPCPHKKGATDYFLSDAMHGQNINLPVCLCVRHTFCQLAYKSDP